jgi:uroporphyrinogen decarboxylase
MNSLERINAAFNKNETDKVPVNHRGFSSRAASYILGREAFVGGGIQQWREAKSLWEGWHEEFIERSFADAVEVSYKTGQDILRPSYWRAKQKPTRKIDEYTYSYEYGSEKDWKVLLFDPASEQASISYVQQSSLTLDDLKNNVIVEEKNLLTYEPNEEDFVLNIKAQKLFGKEKVVEVGGVALGIPIDQAEAWFEAMLIDPGLVRAMICNQVELARKNVEFLSKYGFRYFFGGADFASDSGPMYSPKLFDELILPGLKEVCSICHENGVKFLFASDGNLWSVADSLFFKSGVDGYFEVDRKAGMDLERLRNEYPELTLLGNVSSWILSQGNQADIKEEVLSCQQVAKRHKGVIVGLSNYILPETPHKNIDILLETLEQNR